MNEDIFHVLVPLYIDILFQENSPTLHQSPLSFFSISFPVSHKSLVNHFFELMWKEMNKLYKFSLAPIATSILTFPKFGFLNKFVEKCSMTMALNTFIRLQYVMKEVDEGGLPLPTLDCNM